MSKKLSKKEREEVVTKGYLEDQNYVTKDFLQAQNYVSKDYLDERFQYFTDVLRDEYQDKFQVIFEELRAIREENARRIEICENRLERVEQQMGFA